MNAPALSLIPGITPLAALLDEEFQPPRLDALVPGSSVHERHWREALYAPLREFVSRPGKEFRSTLTHIAYRIAGGEAELPEAVPQLVEILHAGSLIVDDIEDESRSRRGGPALHCTVGLPKALNAANWLYFWPACLIGRLKLSSHVQLSLHRWMSQTLLNCHYGQALDLSVTVGKVSQAETSSVVRALTTLKTGALMGFAAASGALCAQAPPNVVVALAQLGQEIGVGLQMLDDLSGILSERHAHKGHEDLLNGRLTWVWAWLADDLPEEAFSELRRQQLLVQARDLHPEVLCDAIRGHVIGHRARVHQHLEQAFSALTTTLGLAPGVGELRRVLAVLERSYE